MKRWAYVLSIAAWASVTTAIADGPGDQANLKENLDLPYDAVVAAEQAEEVAPEVIVLYGQTYEGGGFVFLGEGST